MNPLSVIKLLKHVTSSILSREEVVPVSRAIPNSSGC